MSVFLFKVSQAAYSSANPSDGTPVTVFIKAHDCPAKEGDVAILCTTESTSNTPTPKACLIVTSKADEDPACYSVIIEKFDPTKKASHLIRYPSAGGLVEWRNLRSENTTILYMNGEEISNGILGSSQIEGVNVKLMRTKHTLQLYADNCIILGEGELANMGEEVESLQICKKLERGDHIKQVQQLLKERSACSVVLDEHPGANQDTSDNGSRGGLDTANDNDLAHLVNNQPKREVDDEAESQKNKKFKTSPEADNVEEDSTTKPPNVDLIRHIAEVALMVKDMDDEHSERLSKVEMEVVRIRSILQQHSLITSHMASPSVTTPNSAKKSRSSKNVQKKPSFSLSDIHTGELIAVRADKSISPDSYYWMARVVGVGKLVKVRWFEPCEFAQNWFYLDKEDEIEVNTIFAKNFELVMKPVKHPAGNIIDIFKPLTDLSKYDKQA